MYDYESYYEPDEPVEDVVAAFENGEKAVTVQQYYRRSDATSEAIQWIEDNREAVLEWLTQLGVAYTYNEISSAGELYIYLNGGPVIVYNTDYIVKMGPTSEVLVIGEKTFTASWTTDSPNNR